MKVPLDKVADNLPPPEKPVPVSAADVRVSDYRGIGTQLSLWEDVAVSGPAEVREAANPGICVLARSFVASPKTLYVFRKECAYLLATGSDIFA